MQSHRHGIECPCYVVVSVLLLFNTTRTQPGTNPTFCCTTLKLYPCEPQVGALEVSCFLFFSSIAESDTNTQLGLSLFPVTAVTKNQNENTESEYSEFSFLHLSSHMHV
jgi:hypothetical protein